MTTTKPFQLGSVLTGTLRTEDLLPIITYTIAELTHDHRSNTSHFNSEAVAEAYDDAIAFMSQPDWSSVPACNYNGVEWINIMAQALNELCPPFVYFGSRPGDGADFGFWPDMDRLFEATRWGSFPSDQDQRETWILADEGVIVHITNDEYSSVTVMDMDRQVLWSTV
jgi:hypothetical protein